MTIPENIDRNLFLNFFFQKLEQINDDRIAQAFNSLVPNDNEITIAHLLQRAGAYLSFFDGKFFVSVEIPYEDYNFEVRSVNEVFDFLSQALKDSKMLIESLRKALPQCSLKRIALID